ncbi:MAG: hypothetical protein ABIH37_02050 [archaeon]
MNKLLIFVCVFLISLSSISALVIDSVIMDSSGIKPGESTHIEIGLRNNGDADVSDVSVFLDLKEIPFAPFDSSSEYGIDEIREGKLKYANFELVSLNNAKPQTYKIPVQISYLEDGKSEKSVKESLISLDVRSEPIIDVSVEDSLLLKGKDNQVSIKIINKGLSDIRFLEVEVEKSTKFSLLSQKNVYVGDLDSDDFDSVDFQIFFKEDISENFNLPVILKFKDVFNKEYEESFEVPVKVYTEKKAVELGLMQKSNITGIIILIIVLIIIWIIYRNWRKRRKRES